LIAIGPKQLPEVARAVGKLLGEFKRTVGEVTSTVASARDETDKAIRKVTDDLASASHDISHSIQNPPPNLQKHSDAQAVQSVTAPSQVDATSELSSGTPAAATSGPPSGSFSGAAEIPLHSIPQPIVKLPDHPGDPPWIVNPAIPNPNKPPGGEET
jgi:Sec-independent protein translocase protein TatA